MSETISTKPPAGEPFRHPREAAQFMAGQLELEVSTPHDSARLVYLRRKDGSLITVCGGYHPLERYLRPVYKERFGTDAPQLLKGGTDR